MLVGRGREKVVLERVVSNQTDIKHRRIASTREVEDNRSEDTNKRAAIRVDKLLVGTNSRDTREVIHPGVISKEVTPPNLHPRATNTSRRLSPINLDTSPAIATRGRVKADIARSGAMIATAGMEDTVRRVDTGVDRTKHLPMEEADQILARTNPLMGDIGRSRARISPLMEVIDGTTKLSRLMTGETTVDRSSPPMADTGKSRSVARDHDLDLSRRARRSVDRRNATLGRSSSRVPIRVGIASQQLKS